MLTLATSTQPPVELQSLHEATYDDKKLKRYAIVGYNGRQIYATTNFARFVCKLVYF